MRAGVLACQSEAVAISTSATGYGALTVVATGRADVPMASAVGPAAARSWWRHWAVPGIGGIGGNRLGRGPVSRPRPALRPMARPGARPSPRPAVWAAHRPAGGRLRYGGHRGFRPGGYGASTADEAVLGEAFTAAEAAFEVVAVAADGDPILGLSTTSSCSAISTTALASIASCIMESKKPMSELSRRRYKELSCRRSGRLPEGLLRQGRAEISDL